MHYTKQTALRSVFLVAVSILAINVAQAADTHVDLIELFEEWREFESPPLLDGAPDYTAEQFENRQPDYLALRDRLFAMEIAGWPVDQQVDWQLVRAEMNGYEFNHRVLKPWVRDPAYYQSLRSLFSGTNRRKLCVSPNRALPRLRTSTHG